MMGAFAAIGQILGGIGSSVLAPILGYFTNRDTLNEKGFEVGAGTDAQVQVAYLNSQVQMAALQASQNQWWGARLIVLVLAGLVAFHFGYVVIDSTPIHGHVIGSWRVAALPAPLNKWEGSIIMSFFIVVPAAPVMSAVAAWLHRK